MKKKILLVGKLALISQLILSNVYATERKATDRYFYIGGDLGIAEPVKKTFDHEDLELKKTTTMRLKQSKLQTGRLGYSFYPGMMVEVSFTNQPKYRLHYLLPESSLGKILGTELSIPKTPGQTQVKAQVYTLNFIYQMEKQIGGLEPYLILGGGLARINVSPTQSFYTIPDKFKPAIPLIKKSGIPVEGDKIAYFRINKTNSDCFVWQAGVGVSREIVKNFSIDVSAKLQVVHDVKIKYDTFSIDAKKYIPSKPIKKTLGVGEYCVGFTYKLPF